MKTSAELIKEVDAELNAVKAADMGLEAAQAFAQEAANRHAEGDVIKTKEALDNLLSILPALRKAIPANVVPASAGPVGKNPHEQYLEQAAGIVASSLVNLNEAAKHIQEALADANAAVDHSVIAIAAIKSPNLKAA